jgi:erythromycin esterase-like protein
MSVHAASGSRLTFDDVVAIKDRDQDYDRLLEWVGDRRFVLLGEASHGSHEFYRERARITKRLIEEKGFVAVAVEADWPDAYRVNRYVLGRSSDDDASSALADFERFPEWMWRNKDVVRFVSWLRERNDRCEDPLDRARFYGLDLYSLRASMEAVVDYLRVADPDAASRARERYSCFDLIGAQNARLVHNAERYYRAMYQGRVSSWNLRDEHMAETLRNLDRHLEGVVGRSKIVVWEHNSHVGDARSTELGSTGELNVGQLARATWNDECFLVGFTTHHGRVSAASDWGGPVQRKDVRPALVGSYEDLLHYAPAENFFVRLGAFTPEVLRDSRLERAIGVIYRPETERSSHWFHADLAHQFDVVVHLDETSAVEPLDRTTRWDAGEPPETYPSGL